MKPIILYIPEMGIAYQSHYVQNGMGHGEIRFGPRVIQPRDIPAELRNQIAALIAEYEIKRRGFNPDQVEVKFGQTWNSADLEATKEGLT